MDMRTVKSEVNFRSRTFCMVEGDVPEVKCVKRRRRSPTYNSLQDGRQQSQVVQVDQATATTTTTVKRSSRFRGVSRHRWTGRYEAHLWDKGSWNVTQRKKGKQVYLGAYNEEESAARAYDLAAIKYWGMSTFTNFPVCNYAEEIELMQHVTREEYLATLRRRSNGFARGASKYRGVARHHHNGRWEARIGRVFGNKYLYLGTYSTQEEAARAYDIAAIEYRGINAITNFDLSKYIKWLKPGANSPAIEGLSADLQTMQTFSNEINTRKNPAFSFNSSSFATGDFSFSHKQEILETKLPLSPCNKPPSPTALSLLLRSSMFKELMAKNGDAANEELEANNMNNKSQTCGEDDFKFYNGNNNVAYVCSYNDKKLTKVESPGNTASSMHDQTRPPVQYLWNDLLNMPPSIH